MIVVNSSGVYTSLKLLAAPVKIIKIVHASLGRNREKGKSRYIKFST